MNTPAIPNDSVPALPPHFAALTARRLEELRITQSDFARAVKETPQFVSDVMRSRRLPATAKLDRWLDALRLAHGSPERQRFSDAYSIGKAERNSYAQAGADVLARKLIVSERRVRELEAELERMRRLVR